MTKISLFIFISIFTISSIAFAQDADKIGYVDLSRAFDEYQKTKDFDKDLEKKGEAKQQEREKLVKDIRKMRDELDLLNEKAKKEKEAVIEDRVKELQDFDQDAKTDLLRERENMVRDILKEMNEVIQHYGKKEGYTIILNDRVLLYGDATVDLTDEIIRVLNENYKK